MKTPLQLAKEALDTAINQKKTNQSLISSIGPAIIEVLKPVLDRIAFNSKLTKEEIKEAISSVQFNIPKIEIPEGKISVKLPEINVASPEVNVNVPDVIVPEIKLPKIIVPKPEVTVNVPEIKVPKLSWPEGDMPIKGLLGLSGYDRSMLDDPIPVQIRDASGKPVNFGGGSTSVISGGGGKSDFLTIKGFSSSAYSDLTNGDGRLRVSVETGGSGLTDNELRASSIPVEQVSGSAWSVFVSDVFATTATSSVVNPDNRVRVELPAGATGLTDIELRASSIPTEQVSGSIWSTYVTGIFNSTYADVINPDNRIKVELPTGSSGLTDNELRASSIPVEQVSGSMWSVYVSGSTGTMAATILNGDGLYRDTFPVSGTVAVSGSVTSTGAYLLNGDGLYRDTMPISGTVAVSGVTNTVGTSLVGSDGLAFGTSKPIPVTMVTGVSASVNATIIDSAGNYRDTFPISGTVLVSDITASVKTALVDSSGIQYSGSNPLPTYLVSGAAASTVAVGVTVADAVDDNSAPIKTGGIARTANPTAVAGGDIVSSSYDTVGRQLMRPVQVRGLMATAYVSVSNGTETTLLAGSAGFYHDLVYVLASNSSTVAVGVDVRPVTAGNIVLHLEIPANGTVGVATPVPMPQIGADGSGNNWTVDLPDITGTTVYVTGLFTKEI